ncbi:MAG: hypothetical protein ACK52I_23555 [Pseudomonadota bacterium]|jgi:hypothetical protein
MKAVLRARHGGRIGVVDLLRFRELPDVLVWGGLSFVVQGHRATGEVDYLEGVVVALAHQDLDRSGDAPQGAAGA